MANKRGSIQSKRRQKFAEMERVREEMLAKAAPHTNLFRKLFLQEARKMNAAWLGVTRQQSYRGDFFKWNELDPSRSRAGVETTLCYHDGPDSFTNFATARTNPEGDTTIFYGIGKSVTVRQDGKGGLVQEDVVRAVRALDKATKDKRLPRHKF